MWSVLRAQGINANLSGGPLGFADLYRRRLAVATYALVTTGIVAVCAGLAAAWPGVLAVGGGLLAAAGLVAAGNLAATPVLLRRRSARPTGRGVRLSFRQES